MTIQSNFGRRRVPFVPGVVRATLLALVAVGAWACDDAVAPDGATLTLTAEPAEVALDSTVTLRVVLRLAMGDLVPYDADVTFSVTQGSLCSDTSTNESPAPSCTLPPAALPQAVEVRARNGVASLQFRGTSPDTVKVLARSGPAADSTTVVVKAGETSVPADSASAGTD